VLIRERFPCHLTYSIIRFFFFPFVVVFGVILCIFSIPFLGAPKPFDFSPLIAFSLCYAILFSAPFFILKITKLSENPTEESYVPENSNPLPKSKIEIVSMVIILSSMVGVSIFAIRSVIQQISNIAASSGFQNLSVLTVTIYLSIASSLFIGAFAFLFYYSSADLLKPAKANLRKLQNKNSLKFYPKTRCCFT